MRTSSFSSGGDDTSISTRCRELRTRDTSLELRARAPPSPPFMTFGLPADDGMATRCVRIPYHSDPRFRLMIGSWVAFVFWCFCPFVCRRLLIGAILFQVFYYLRTSHVWFHVKASGGLANGESVSLTLSSPYER